MPVLPSAEHALVIAGGGPTGLMLALRNVSSPRAGRCRSQGFRQDPVGHISDFPTRLSGQLAGPIAPEREGTGFTPDDSGVESSCPTACRYGRSISSGATEDAV